MAHFAKLNKDNIVEQVIVISNDIAINEKSGIDYIKSLGIEGKWIQTSYNNKIRGKFAGIGDFYDKDQDIFIAAIFPEIVEDETLA